MALNGFQVGFGLSLFTAYFIPLLTPLPATSTWIWDTNIQPTKLYTMHYKNKLPKKNKKQQQTTIITNMVFCFLEPRYLA